MNNLILFIFVGVIYMEMWKNKIKRRSNVEVEKFEDCIKVSIGEDTDKSKLKK